MALRAFEWKEDEKGEGGWEVDWRRELFVTGGFERRLVKSNDVRSV